MPNETESQDLARFHRESDRIRQAAFNAMRHALAMPEEHLRHTGYPTREACAIALLRAALGQLDKLTKAHIERYPDR